MFTSLKIKIVVSHLIVAAAVALTISVAGYFLIVDSMKEVRQSTLEVTSFEQPVISGSQAPVALLESEHIEVPVKLRNYFIVIIAAVIICAIWGSWSLASSITSPLVKLAAASKAIAKGSLLQKVETTADEQEITSLVEAFNEMASNLSNMLISRDYVENVFQSIIDSIVIVDEEGKIKTVNSSTLNMLGYEKKDLIGAPAGIIFGENDGEGDIRKIRYQVNNKQCVVNFVGEYVTNDQRRIPVMMSGSLLTNRDGTHYDLVVLAKDVTERKKSEEDLQALLLKLEQSNSELQDFAHIASHDLQEPLRKIMSFGDRLQTKYADSLGEQGCDYLMRMHRAAGRMQDLIQSLLKYSRVTTKAQPFEQVDLSTVLDEVLSDLEVRIQETGGQVKASVLPVFRADRLQMRQLFQNLIGNALKFHRKGEPPLVEISGRSAGGNGTGAHPHLHEKETYKITVQDNGIGFDEKYIDRIFAVFQRLHGRNEYEGSGIGLSICRKIVERHGGGIMAKSAPGQGTAFVISLPLSEIKEVPQNAKTLETHNV